LTAPREQRAHATQAPARSPPGLRSGFPPGISASTFRAAERGGVNTRRPTGNWAGTRRKRWCAPPRPSPRRLPAPRCSARAARHEGSDSALGSLGWDAPPHPPWSTLVWGAARIVSIWSASRVAGVAVVAAPGPAHKHVPAQHPQIPAFAGVAVEL